MARAFVVKSQRIVDRSVFSVNENVAGADSCADSLIAKIGRFVKSEERSAGRNLSLKDLRRL